MVSRGEFSRPQSVLSALGPLGSFLQEPRAGLRGVLPVGTLGCVSPAEPSRVCTAGNCQQATVRSPASWGLRRSAGPFLLEPQAGLQTSPTPSWVVCRMGQWTGCPSSPAPPRHPRPKAISCRSRKFLRRAPRLWHGAAAVLVSDERAWGGRGRQVLGRDPIGPGPGDTVMSAATPPRWPRYVMASLGLLGQEPVAL